MYVPYYYLFIILKSITNINSISFIIQVCQKGYFDLALRYLELGAFPSALDSAHRSPLTFVCELQVATEFHKSEKFKSLHFQLLQELIETAPVAINVSSLKKSGMPLHSAVLSSNSIAITKLLQAGATVDSPDHVGNTPLHIACMDPSENILRLLTSVSTASLFRRNSFGSSPYEILISLYRSSVGQNRRRLASCVRLLDSQHRQHLDSLHAYCIRHVPDLLEAPENRAELAICAISMAHRYARYFCVQLEAQSSFVKNSHRRLLSQTPLDFLPSQSDCYHNMYHLFFTETFYRLCYSHIISLYDLDLSVPNSFFSRTMKHISKTDPSTLQIKQKYVEIWFFDSLSLAHQSTLLTAHPELAERIALVKQSYLDSTDCLHRFASAPSPHQKVKALQSWVVTISTPFFQLVPEGDPDFHLVLLGFSLASSCIPNLWSHYFFLVDCLLDGLDPSNPDSPDISYASQIRMFRNAMHSIQSLSNNVKWIITKIQDGICANQLDSAPLSVHTLFASIISELCQPNLSVEVPFVFKNPFPGSISHLLWFAEEWGLELSELNDGHDVSLRVLSPSDFLLKPHIMEALLVQLSSGEH